jgi:predicted metal-dependent hydrolase
MKKNLFDGLPDVTRSEVFESLLERKGLVLERIVSRGQATPAGQWLSQDKDEWVLLAAGRARLRFEGSVEFELAPGDYVFIPAGTRHRVEWTQAAGHTVWLALHLDAGKEKQRPADTGVIREVKVIRSRRRKRTASARLYGGAMYVYVPANTGERELERMIKDFRGRFSRKRLKDQLDESGLRKVAEGLNLKYFGGTLDINSIEYVTNQTSKFGCCDYGAGAIRISHAVAAMPAWVRDYVIVHELAHLIEHGHGKRFHELVARYPLTERAKGFLLAKGLSPETPEE